mmetsp:Transcript_55782/g.109200  ORF Transcript_55782/g.109200 Transcript_55782/m.109200 type:complete len:252 (-) Transcript_55782:106-861(-)
MKRSKPHLGFCLHGQPERAFRSSLEVRLASVSLHHSSANPKCGIEKQCVHVCLCAESTSTEGGWGRFVCLIRMFAGADFDADCHVQTQSLSIRGVSFRLLIKSNPVFVEELVLACMRENAKARHRKCVAYILCQWIDRLAFLAVRRKSNPFFVMADWLHVVVQLEHTDDCLSLGSLASSATDLYKPHGVSIHACKGAPRALRLFIVVCMYRFRIFDQRLFGSIPSVGQSVGQELGYKPGRAGPTRFWASHR